MKFTNEQIEQGLDKIFDNLLQTKDVEASESMEITPDEGYAGIKKVNLTVKGGGGSASGSGLTYYKFPTYTTLEEVPDADIAVVYNAARVRMEVSGVSSIGATYIGGGKFREDNILTVRAFAIDKSARYVMGAPGQIFADVTLEEYLSQAGVSLSNYEEITEEEFYNLNA